MKTLLIGLTTATALLTTSCNTFIGMGRDIRLMGEGMEKSAAKSAGGSSGTTSANGTKTTGQSAAPVY